LLTSVDGLTGGAPSGDAMADASGDAGASADGALRDDADADGTVLRNDFEGTCPEQSGFAVTSSTAAHSGARACKVCNQSAPYYAYALGVISNPPLGSRYHGEAWVQVVPGANGDSRNVQLTMRSYSFASGSWQQVDIKVGQARVSNGWTRLAVDFATDKAADGIDFYVYVIGAATGDCLLIDDAVVERAP
jgi:hypothetical protein